MAHEIDMSNGRANMAYAGEEPWHGLGTKIDGKASINDWRKAAGLDFKILKGDMLMRAQDGTITECKELNRSILYRDDTMERLSVMSDSRYKVVQPDEILSFIGDTVKAMGWQMETAGALFGGRKVWAMANIGENAMIGNGDAVKGYLLAATACDGTMGSEFMFTTKQVVCNNTLQMALGGRESQPRIKVYHFTTLDINAVKAELGIASTVWSTFIENAKRLAAVKVTPKKATAILREAFAPDEKEIGGVTIEDDEFFYDNPQAAKILQLFDGRGIGAGLSSQKGTAWGLVSATTEFYDHAVRARTVDNRLNSAWFGDGATRKDAVFAACLDAA